MVSHPARTQPEYSRVTWAALVLTLRLAGCADDAMAAAKGLIEAAEATRNPHALSFALLAYGMAFSDADPAHARDALRRGLVIAQDSGNRGDESRIGGTLCHLEATHGDPLAAFEYLAVAIRNYHDAGNSTNLRPTLSFLAAILDRIGRYESAATIAGFAVVSPLATMWTPELGTAITPPTRCPRRPDLRIACPRGRDDENRRHGDVRIRPNRRGPNRTERCLEVDPNETSVGTMGGHVRNLRRPSGVTP